jgi:hypothetical protein
MGPRLSVQYTLALLGFLRRGGKQGQADDSADDRGPVPVWLLPPRPRPHAGRVWVLGPPVSLPGLHCPLPPPPILSCLLPIYPCPPDTAGSIPLKGLLSPDTIPTPYWPPAGPAVLQCVCPRHLQISSGSGLHLHFLPRSQDQGECSAERDLR